MALIEVTLIIWVWLSLGFTSLFFFRFVRKQNVTFLDVFTLIPLGGITFLYITSIIGRALIKTLLVFKDHSFLNFSK
jgi:hypothetical protein